MPNFGHTFGTFQGIKILIMTVGEKVIIPTDILAEKVLEWYTANHNNLSFSYTALYFFFQIKVVNTITRH